MKQNIRFNTFETNSSSMHSLILMSKEDFEKFKNKELYYAPREGFKSYKDLINTAEFKEECPYYEEEQSIELKEKMLKDYINDYFDTEYAPGYTLGYLDAEYETVYDKDGNEQVAMSIYIGDC